MATTKYYQNTLPTQRTKIITLVASKPARCHKCKRDVYPNVIVSGFLDKPLSVCPNCHSVVQYQEKTNGEK